MSVNFKNKFNIIVSYIFVLILPAFCFIILNKNFYIDNHIIKTIMILCFILSFYTFASTYKTYRLRDNINNILNDNTINIIDSINLMNQYNLELFRRKKNIYDHKLQLTSEEEKIALHYLRRYQYWLSNLYSTTGNLIFKDSYLSKLACLSHEQFLCTTLVSFMEEIIQDNLKQGKSIIKLFGYKKQGDLNYITNYYMNEYGTTVYKIYAELSNSAKKFEILRPEYCEEIVNSYVQGYLKTTTFN